MPFVLKSILTLMTLVIVGDVLMLGVKAQQEEVDSDNSEEIPVLFMEEGCPYCGLVEDFIGEKGLEDQIDIKDIHTDPSYAALYNEMFEEIGVPLQERGGVPVLFDGEEYFDGASEIIIHLGEKFDISVDDYLPDTHEDDSGDGEDENRSNKVVLGILGVGIFASVGFLIFSSRDKKGR